MKTYPLRFEQKLPIPIAEAWDFFSSPLNLAKITPPEMKFKVTSNQTTDTQIYPGMIITYTLSPLLGIKVNWATEITQVKFEEYFVDDQRTGPYALWHHEHHFKTIKGGVLMTDIINYAVPFGIIGQLANQILVAKQIKKIFAHRKTMADEFFGIFKNS